jgi:cell division septum initiation protein DivIVA
MSAYRVIDKLEIVVREGVWMPFGWRAVNSDRVLDLIEKLRSALPEDANRSRRADSTLDSTAKSGGSFEPNVADDTRVKTLENEIVAKAQARADDIVEQAQRAARDIRRGADEYADQVLASLDNSLGRALAAVQKGRQALAMPASGNGKAATQTSAT